MRPELVKEKEITTHLNGVLCHLHYEAFNVQFDHASKHYFKNKHRPQKSQP